MAHNAQRTTHNAAFIFMVSVLSLGLLGCDKLNLNFLNPKKPEAKKPAASMAVKGTVIAKINNFSITLEDLNQEIEAYNAMVPADRPELKVSTREQKINYLKNEMVRRALLYQEALDKRLDTNEDVVKALEKTKMDLLVVELVREEAQKVDATAKEIEDYYNVMVERKFLPNNATKAGNGDRKHTW